MGVGQNGFAKQYPTNDGRLASLGPLFMFMGSPGYPPTVGTEQVCEFVYSTHIGVTGDWLEHHRPLF